MRKEICNHGNTTMRVDHLSVRHITTVTINLRAREVMQNKGIDSGIFFLISEFDIRREPYCLSSNVFRSFACMIHLL
jgi:hypothetical protein